MSQYEIMVSVYFDTKNEVRGLVTVYKDGESWQTVGSAVVGTEELATMMRTAMYTLNALRLEAREPEKGGET